MFKWDSQFFKGAYGVKSTEVKKNFVRNIFICRSFKLDGTG